MYKSKYIALWSILLAATVILADASAWAVEAPGSAPNRDRPLSVVFEAQERAVIAAEVPAEVVSIKKQLGESFSKGDVLVELESTVYEANLVRARSESAATQKALSVASNMSKYKSATPLDIANAQKEAGASRANLMIAKKEVSDTKILAPFSGHVKQVMVREYEWVDKGTEVVEIVNDKALRATILMPSTGYGRVKLGQEVSISVNETGATVPCTITHISKDMDPASGTFEVYGEVQNTDGTIVSGMTGTLIMGQGQ